MRLEAHGLRNISLAQEHRQPAAWCFFIQYVPAGNKTLRSPAHQRSLHSAWRARNVLSRRSAAMLSLIHI